MERDEKRDYLVSLRESTGMTRKDFAIEYNIPYPTITDWELIVCDDVSTDFN